MTIRQQMHKWVNQLDEEHLIGLFAHWQQTVKGIRDVTRYEVELTSASLREDWQRVLDRVHSEQDAMALWFYLDSRWLIWRTFSSCLKAADTAELAQWEFANELENHHIYHAGDRVESGDYICRKCGKLREIREACILFSCRYCHGRQFKRIVLADV